MYDLTSDEINEFEKLSSNQKETLILWCGSLNEIKTINTKRSSYGLKHLFENSTEGFYISNGAFKVAMLKAGFKYKMIRDSKNWYFNISEKSLALTKSR